MSTPAPLCDEAGSEPIEDRLRQNIGATIEASLEETLAAFIGRPRCRRPLACAAPLVTSLRDALPGNGRAEGPAVHQEHGWREHGGLAPVPRRPRYARLDTTRVRDRCAGGARPARRCPEPGGCACWGVHHPTGPRHVNAAIERPDTCTTRSRARTDRIPLRRRRHPHMSGETGAGSPGCSALALVLADPALMVETECAGKQTEGVP